MPPLSDLAAVNRALRKVRLDRSSDRSSAPVRRALWAPFLKAVHQEILEGGRAALVAQESGEQVQLYVEGAEGRMRGAFRDPAGIATALHARGMERVSFEGLDGARALPPALVALLEGPFEPLPGTDLFVRGDYFVARVTDEGLPAMAGLAWKAREEREPAPAARMSAREFEARARRMGSAASIVALYKSAVLEHTAGPHRAERVAYIPVLLRIARRFNEGEDDVASAAALWRTAAETTPDPDGRRRVVAVVRSVARQRSAGEGRPRDVAGAAILWRTAYELIPDDAGRLGLVKSTMKVANLLTDLSGPWGAVDVEGAVLAWQTVWRMHHSPDDDARVVRTMMDVANRLTDLRTSSPIRVEPAVVIWRGLLALDLSPEDRTRIVATMMDLAHRISDVDEPREDLEGAIAIWHAVLEHTPDPEDRLVVIKHVMAAANRRSRVGEGRLDLPGAVTLWRAAAELSHQREDRIVAARTMMAVARKLVDHGELDQALFVWAAAAELGDGDAFRLRTQKSILGLASGSPAFASEAANCLQRALPEDLDPAFAVPLLAALRYYAHDYEGVLEMGRDPTAPPGVRALTADALRKLGRLDEAVAVADRELHTLERCQDVVALDARVSALCCRAYCRLEQSRAGANQLEAAEQDLREAESLAQGGDLAMPPRVHTGLGYVLRAQGREAEAQAAFDAALRVDADNRKALGERPEIAAGGDAPEEPGGFLRIDAFQARVRAATRPEPVVALLESQARSHLAPAALAPYLRAVMERAHWFHEQQGDLDAALALWTACARLQTDAEAQERILATLRAVARQYTAGEGRPRDVAAGVRLLTTVHHVARDPDQALAVVKTLMDVANRFTDLDGPWQAVDIPAAIALWRGAWSLHHSPEDDERVIRTMARVATLIEKRGDGPPEQRRAAAESLREAVAALREERG